MSKKTSFWFKNYLLWAFQEKDWTIKGLRKTLGLKKENDFKFVNKFMASDFARLGAEIHAASYTVKLGGRCKLHDSSKWIHQSDKNYTAYLESQKGREVEALDLSRTVIQFEGLSNIESCGNLKELYLNECPFVDDWFIARLAHSFSHTLEKLEIKKCARVTDAGVLKLGYLHKLKSLNIENMVNAANKEYIAFLLEENNPNLVVEGVDHLSESSVSRIEQMFKREDEQIKSKLSEIDGQNNSK